MKPQSKTTCAVLVSAAALLCSGAAFAGDHGPKMTTYSNAASIHLASMNIEGIKAFLTDVVTSDENAPLTCGLFRLEKSDPLVYTYSYDEVKFMISGEMTLAEAGGRTFRAKAGDMVYFDKGAKITFSSNSSGLAFYCGQRAKGEL